MAHPHGISPTSRMSPTEHAHSVQFDLEKGHNRSPTARPPSIRSDPEPDNLKPQYPSPILTRRRTGTAASRLSMKTVDESPLRPNWQPGQEPGLDPSKPNGGRLHTPTPHEDCQITVVDYGEGEEDFVMHDFDNQGLIKFVQQKQEDWIKCRWININGLSWDVIQALGKQKKLHGLAMEDLVNMNNRTKADWYAGHTYMVMTLQKLVHMHAEDDRDSESDDDSTWAPKKMRGRFSKAFHKLFSGFKAKEKYDEKERKDNTVGGVHVPTNGYVTGHTDAEPDAPTQKLRTLQRYHFGGNAERMAYMERHSPLTRKGLAVSAEQVSIFLTNDNTVISFFESSADDIEKPILLRLSSAETILRRSCDASMLVQAIIDAIIDLAIPVSTAYQGLIGELELDVLTEPSIKHTTSLYIMTSEITMMRGFVSPIINLINALRDHKSNAASTGVGGRGDLKQAASGVKISAMAQTYLGDVEDHVLLMTDYFDSMRRSCDNMIDLIFNTISAYQNESMKQLTVVTIIFLPLSFLTGYFGMNFDDFRAIRGHSESYFWIIALPVAFAVTLFLMRDIIKWYFDRLMQRRGISRSRKGRLQREAKAQAKIGRQAAERGSGWNLEKTK